MFASQTQTGAVANAEVPTDTWRIYPGKLARLSSRLPLFMLDAIVLIVCFFAARISNFVLHPTSVPSLEVAFFGWGEQFTYDRAIVYPLLSIIALGTFWLLGHYSRRRLFWEEWKDVILVCAAMTLVEGAFVFFSKGILSRWWLLTNWVLIAALIPVSRVAFKAAMISRGRWIRPAVVIGNTRLAYDAASALQEEPTLGFRPRLFVSIENISEPHPERGDDGRVIAPERHVDETALSVLLEPDDHIVVALSLQEMARADALIERLSVERPDIDIVLPLRGIPLNGSYLNRFIAHDLSSLRLPNNLARPLARLTKRLFDLVLAGALVVLLAPVLLLLAACVRSSGKPIIFSHKRIGRNGQYFMCHKFRSMVPNAQALLDELLARDPDARSEWARNHKLTNDPRITPFGRFIRATSLDELPQLLNVLKGEMSLVGPRPVVQAELDRYGPSAFYYKETVPGITGLWQVSGRSDTSFERRVELDVWYARNWSLWFDIVILFRTIRIVFSKTGAY